MNKCPDDVHDHQLIILLCLFAFSTIKTLTKKHLLSRIELSHFGYLPTTVYRNRNSEWVIDIRCSDSVWDETRVRIITQARQPFEHN